MGLKDAYTTSAQIFHQVTRKNSPDLVAQLDELGDNEIIVIPGVHDHVETILDTLSLPYQMGDLNSLDYKSGNRVAFVNCTSYGGQNKNAEKFVKEGGRLVTTDWALGLVTHTFPKHLHKTCETEDDVVEIQGYHPVAQKFIGMHYVECRPKWWLEGSSHVYGIKDDGVVPIIVSREMKEKYGQPYVAVGFPHGKGEVLHFISHFELQRTHQRTTADKGTLDDFLKKMKASKTVTMANANMAELEAAYSTLNTVAQLCAKAPILNYGTKSVLTVHK
jgi:hypothetical protein